MSTKNSAEGAGTFKARKKVLVSGCFDLLHSGHVAFLQDAAKLGDLYVRLGSDENIGQLKHHKPMYNEQERLFMVKNIKCVHDVEISKGTGRYDFFEDMKLLKPDIYFCNEDASGMEPRIQSCKQHGVEMIIHPRIPEEGLEMRSSTDMKARLREMVLKEEGELTDLGLNDIPAFHTIFPWRLCFAGGWLDLKWCNEIYPGSVITVNIKHHPGICDDLCGLATSSRKHAIKLWNGKLPRHLDAVTAAKYLYGAENFEHFGKAKGTMKDWERISYSAGSQDHIGLMFPGINRLNFSGQHWPSSLQHVNDTTIVKWLESVLNIIRIPFESRPGSFNSQKVNNVTDETIPLENRIAMVKLLAEASDLVWKGITEMDSDAVGKGLSDTMKAWETMLPYTVDPYLKEDSEKSQKLREFWTKYDIPYTKGCLFSGAGGGYLMVITEPNEKMEGAMKVKINLDDICPNSTYEF